MQVLETRRESSTIAKRVVVQGIVSVQYGSVSRALVKRPSSRAAIY